MDFRIPQEPVRLRARAEGQNHHGDRAPVGDANSVNSRKSTVGSHVLTTEGAPRLTDRPYAHTLYVVDYRQLITIEPGKRSGKPCIRGLRITVSDVLDYLASGMSEDDVLRDFPDLTREDIRACLAFAADRERRLTATGTM
jgi:uncharacterized protein (DUF433 family)